MVLHLPRAGVARSPEGRAAVGLALAAAAAGSWAALLVAAGAPSFRLATILGLAAALALEAAAAAGRLRGPAAPGAFWFGALATLAHAAAYTPGASLFLVPAALLTAGLLGLALAATPLHRARTARVSPLACAAAAAGLAGGLLVELAQGPSVWTLTNAFAAGGFALAATAPPSVWQRWSLPAGASRGPPGARALQPT